MAILLSSCKRIPDERDAYIGTWKSADATLTIRSHGRINYNRPAAGNRIEESFSAIIVKFSGNDIVVSGDVWLDVSEPPHLENGVWRMTVNGDELTKQ
jgi:hypothetical protein